MIDERMMRRALELARKGGVRVSPNPFVGAVFVKSGKVLAEGFHAAFGGDHAEIAAISAARSAGKSLRGATLYVNLEPCIHFGKTPPCVPALIAAGVARIVIAMKDTNPLVCGKGIAAARRGGIRVDVGCLKNEAEALNERFAVWKKTGRPFVGMKVAMSLDGKIATKTGQSKWITGNASRSFVKKLRDSYDAILVGKRTVLRDDPRLEGAKRQPCRIILDSMLQAPSTARVFRDENVRVFTTSHAPQVKMRALRKRGIEVIVFSKTISVDALLRSLAKKNISSVLVEGGAEVFGSFVDAHAINRVYWFVAPRIIGGRNARAAVAGDGTSSLRKALSLKKTTISKIGADVLIQASVR